MKTQTIETYLPEFPGFYNTVFDMDTESEIQYINEDRENKIDYNDLTIDYSGYMVAVAKKYTAFIEKKLQELNLVESIEYQCVRSPKEYNFVNDSIDVKMVVNVEKLQEYFKNDEIKAKFQEYIHDTYTSCDGFISHYSNYSSKWLYEIEHIDDMESRSHKIGSILQFVINSSECIDDLEDYYSVMEDFCVSEYCYYEENNEE